MISSFLLFFIIFLLDFPKRKKALSQNALGKSQKEEGKKAKEGGKEKRKEGQKKEETKEIKAGD